MLAKFSVKKPMTVLVAVILVILLGVVAFTRMTPDLLPSIDFPYVIVVTTYAGASPEQVETTLTKPVEQAAATLDGIKSVQSSSRENYSMVVLQFEDKTNMDAACMNLREKLEQISGSWPDEVTTPTMYKINPDMLPVDVSAVAVEGYDTVELSAFVEDTLLPQLEGVDGVASVSASGMIFRSVQVVINDEKLELLNGKIRDAIDRQFEEPIRELEESRQTLEENASLLDSGEAQISYGWSQLSQGREEAEAQIAQARQELDDREAQMEENLAEAKAVTAIADLRDSLAAQRDEAASQLAALEEGDPAAAVLEAEIASLDGQIAALDAQLPAQDVVAQMRVTVASEDALRAAMEAAEQLLEARAQEARDELDSAAGQLSSGAAQLADAREQMESALIQLDDAAEQIETSRQEAYDAADAKKILSLQTVAQILTAQDFSMPAGYVTEEGTQWLVYVGDTFQSAGELEDLVLFDLGMDGLEPVRLSDVADVAVVDNADTTYARINGTNGVLLSFYKQSNCATAEASENILKAFRRLEGQYEGLTFTTLMDQGDYIHLLVDSVLENLLLGAAFAVVILWLFLRDLRPTFIVACSIPISVTFAIVLMYFSGVTLNVISMSGLAVGVGMLVDNSIVVIENIYRLRKSGQPLFRSAISGAVQVAGAITASTLTTVCVFLPIVFVEGMTRQLFTDMALTVTYSLMASLIVALTLIPAMSSGMLRKVREKKTPVLDFVARIYEKALRWTLRRKAVVLLAALVLLAASAYFALARGFVYMPEMDSTQVSVSAVLPEESSFADLTAAGDEIASRIAEIPEVETVGVMQAGGLASAVGLGSGSGGSGTELTLYVVLSAKKSRSSAEISREIEELCGDLDCEVRAEGSSMDMSALSGSGVELNIYGEDLDDLQETAREVAEILSGMEGIRSVSDGLEETTPKLTVHVDKEKAMEHGLTTAQVYMEIVSAITNERSAATVDDIDSSVVLIGSEAGVSLSDVRDLEIAVTREDGTRETVPLSDIARFEEGETLQAISRSEQRRYLTVSAELEPGYNVTLVTSAAERELRNYETPDGIRLEFTGENETILEGMEDLLLMLGLGVIIVYLIMVAQFQSLLSPFIVMLTIPLAFTGGLIALLIAGFEISIVSMIGFVMLVGIIVNNGIVLIDCMNQLRAGGADRREAVVEACRTRLRPVLMTALTTVLGLIPLAFGFGMGASLVQPVAVVSVGGLVYATFMTLFVVPAIYDAWCRKPPRVVTAEDLEIVEE